MLQLAGILVLGVIAQWVAWRIRLPSILLLLVTGILAGPIFSWLKPDNLFGDLMLPLVSLSVAVIVYEGGLNLKFRELRHVGRVFILMCTVGVLITWLIGTLAAHYIVGFRWAVAALLGAILVVTGPTVIGPILRHLRLRGRVGALLKWEGIIVDPLGAILAVLVFSVVESRVLSEGVGAAALHLGATFLIGVLAGVLAAILLIVALSKFWIPDVLHNPVSLMLMIGTLTFANGLQDEAGLLAVTVMGVALANQKWVSIRHVVEFKETLTVLLISCLFIILSARLQMDDLKGLGWQSLAFVVVMIVVARPLSVLACSIGSSLTWSERCFLCCMAPRGIVAAAITSVFALNLAQVGYPTASDMVPLTFLLVFVTVLFYGVTAAPLARWLGLIQSNPQGILFIGAHPWARSLAHALHQEGIPVFLIDTDWENICNTRMAGLPCHFGSALAEVTRDEIDYTGLGRMLAITSNNEVNSLACLRFVEDFGRQGVYQLPFPPPREERYEAIAPDYQGRLLFGQQYTFAFLEKQVGLQPRISKTKLTAAFDYKSYLAMHGTSVIPLGILKQDGTLQIRTVHGFVEPVAGDMVISFSCSAPHEPAPSMAPERMGLIK